MARARTIVLWALTAEVVVLSVTGVALYFLYRPEAAAAWTDTYGVGSALGREVRVAHLAQDLHRVAAWLALPTSIVAAVLLALRTRPTERVAPGLATGVGLVLVVVAATLTGYLLPWDQLALFAVTVGTNITGYTWLRDDTVRFVLMDGTEILPRTLLKWFVLHVVLGVAVVGLTALGWRRARRTPPIEPAAPAANQPSAEVPVGV